MLKSSDTAFLKEREATKVSEQVQSRSTTKTRVFFMGFLGDVFLASILCLCVCSLHCTDLHHLEQKLGMGKVSKMPRNELIGVPAHHGKTQVPAQTCSDRTFSIPVPLAVLREPRVQDDFQRFWWMEQPLEGICVVCRTAKVTPSVLAGCLSLVLGCSWDL